MKVKLLVLVLALLAVASLSFAQPGAMCIYNEAFPLRKHCASGDPLPIGTKLWLYNDTDNDGWVSCLAPDPDPLAPLCDLPPDCDTGPMGTVNVQFIPMGQGTGTAGTFASDPCIVASGAYPTYGRFYLKVEYCETTFVGCITTHWVRWLSRVFVMPTSIDDILLSTAGDWTCCEWDSVWPTPCLPDLYTRFSPVPYPQGGPQTFRDCAVVCGCGGTPHAVNVGPLVNANRRPHGYVLPGCEHVVTPCDSICEPAANWTFGPLNWVLRMDETGIWYDAIITPLVGATGGCVCIVVDFIEPVEMGEVAIVPLSEAVRIRWRTMSETDEDRFDIYRDGARIASKPAANSSAGASYEYLDAPLENGRTYTYQLRSVDISGLETVHARESVTPTAENALVTEYALHQNYPNPFNPTTKIAFDLVDNNPVTLTVYNTAGQTVAVLLNSVPHGAGHHAITFDSGDLTSGLYFYTVKIGSEFSATKKMLLLK